MLAVIKHNQTRTELYRSHNAGAARGTRLSPPALTIAVDRPAAGNRDLLCIRRTDKRLRARCTKLSLGRIVGMIRRTKQRRVLGNVKRDVALQHNRTGHKGAPRELD